MFEQSDGDEDKDHENNQALFGRREDENAEEPFHFA
jgi:hypothetical protein